MKIKVAVAGTIGKVVSIDPDAGATIGRNFHLPDGSVPTLDELIALFSGGGTLRHKNLQGLQQGNDHPQYPLKFGRETIKGQWDFTQQIWSANGTAAAPAVAFTADPDTGWYHVGANNMGAATGGTLRWDVDTTRVYQSLPLVVNNYSGVLVQNPDIEGTGLHITTTTLDPVDGVGNQIAFIEQVSSGMMNYGFRIEHTGELDDLGDLDWYRHSNDIVGVLFMKFTRNSSQVQFAAGTESAPVFTTFDDLNTGIYFPASDTVSLTAAGNQQFTVSSSAIVGNQPLRLPTGGGPSAPPYSFTGQTSTGVYFTAGGSWAVAHSGVQRFRITSGDITSVLPHQFADGTAAAPSLRFTDDSDTGLYRASTNTLGFAVAGAEAFTMAAGVFSILSTTPRVRWYDSNAGANAKFTEVNGNSGFTINFLDDSGANPIKAWTFGRSGTSVTQHEIYTGAEVEVGRFDTDATAGYTRFLLYDVDTASLQRVKVGANGSGPSGTGRALYIDDTP